MGPIETESNNTMKDEIIFIRNDIILVVFIKTTNFEESTPKVEVEWIFALLHLFSLQNIFQETRLYYCEIGCDICLNSPK